MLIINNIKIIFSAVFAIASIILLNSNLSAAPAVIDDTLESLSIAKNLEYFRDESVQVPIEKATGPEIRWTEISGDTVNLGYSYPVFWFRFSVDNRSKNRKEWYLEIDNPLIEALEMYLPQKEGGFRTIMTGNMLSFDTRQISSRNLTFRIEQKPGIETYYFRISNYYSSNSFLISVMSEKAYLKKSENDNIFFGWLMGVAFILFLYNLLYYIVLREKGYLHLVWIVIFVCLLFFNLFGYAHMYLWPSSTWWAGNAYLIFTCIVMSAFGVYVRTYLETDKYFPIFDKLLSYAGHIPVLLPIALIFADLIPYPRIEMPLSTAYDLIWYIEAPAAYCWFLLLSAWVALRHSRLNEKYSFYIKMMPAVIVLLFSLVLFCALGIKLNPGEMVTSRVIILPMVVFIPLYYAGVVFYAFYRRYRPARYIFAATIAVILGFLIMIFTIIGVLPLTAYSIYVAPGFVILGAVIISIGLTDRLDTMKKEILDAEVKYSELVESSNEIIFSLDRNLNFLTVNRAITMILGFSIDDVINKNFMEFIEETWKKRQDIDHGIVEEYIRELKQTKGSITFRTAFKTNFTNEPIEMSVKLDYSRSERKRGVIFGKAMLTGDDILLPFLDSEKHNYSTNNYLSNARLLIERITRNLVKHIGQSELPSIRLALRETLVNAIEHGNFDINFEDKSKMMDENRYYDFLFARQKDPKYNTRKISVEYTLDSDRVTYRIADEGRGFDYKKMMNFSDDDRFQETLQNGRGLLIASMAFDVVKFNEKGNEVTLVKYFDKR